MKKTCGPMYLDAWLKYTNGDDALTRAFAAGFVNGQAEKVYLGACHAAMFRPSSDRAYLIRELAEDACERYGLLLEKVDDEFWICRDTDTLLALERMQANAKKNSPVWHRRRAELCGVPFHEVDDAFHLRKGYGEHCDAVPGSGAP